MILHSWERCKNLPREARTPKLPQEEFEQLLIDNKRFLDAALPVEQILYICSHRTMVGLSASNTYMIHQVCHENYLNQLGRGGQEDVIGTNATNLCLREGIPVQTIRQENYALRYQHCSFASAPVFSKCSQAVGVLSLITTFGSDLPSGALLMVSYGAKLIEQRLSASSSLPILNCGDLSSLLDLCENSILICDREGCIFAANNHMRNLLGITSTQVILGHHVAELLGTSADSAKIADSINDGIENFDVNVVGKKVKCLYTEQFDSGIGDGSEFTAIVFGAASDTTISVKSGGIKSITDVWIPSDSGVTLIGESPAWLKVKRIIRKVAAVRSARVLIEGESGTGKEQIAKAIHAASGRKGQMITLNCGALPKELLQSELFGYVDGAFTGAKKGGNPGKFELANGGTIFLDEIGEMPLDMQVSLLRVLEERKVVRLGSSKPLDIDLSVIAATNKHLMTEVVEGRFREDLYYRLSAVVIASPPLRECKSDIPILADHLLGRLSDSMNISKKAISNEAIQALMDYSWPGNVRELLNVLEHALVMEEEGEISRSTLSEVLDIREIASRTSRSSNHKAISDDLRLLTEKSKAETIQQIVNNCGGNISKAAKQLNVSRNTIYRYLDKSKQ